MQCQGGQRLQSPAERAGSAARRCTDPRSRGLLPPLAGAGRKRARRRGRRHESEKEPPGFACRFFWLLQSSM
jgi:hypothetical protein